MTVSRKLQRAVRAELKKRADPSKADKMQAYMKSQMPFMGVQSRPMREAAKDAAAAGPETPSDWRESLMEIWRGAKCREERYVAIELSGKKYARLFSLQDMPLYEEMITTGAWWDYVDWVAARRVGSILKAHPKVMKKRMRSWSKGKDMWKARTSIISQLNFKDAIDLDLLYDCIEPSIPSKEFFLRKAIGWALRQHAKVDPDEVRRYVRENEARLSGLSRREALKNIT